MKESWNNKVNGSFSNWWKLSLSAAAVTSLVAVLSLCGCPAKVSAAEALQAGANSTTLHGGTGSTTLQSGTQSTTLQGGTNSTTLQGGTGSTMLQTGTQSTTLQAGTGSTMLQTGTTGSLIQGNVEHEAGPINVLIVLDCSRSMKEKLEGEVKMTIAKNVLAMAIQKIPNDINVGLRVFGQGSYSSDFDCRQSALLVPLGTNNRASIIRRVDRLTPNGLTPLTYAIRQAAEDDFFGVQGPKTMILITDGADTCNEDPCEYIRTLPRRGIKLKVDVVGVDLKKDPGGRAQLNCISSLSGGKYYDANSAADLIKSVSSSVDKAISGHVILKQGGNVNNGETPPELMPLHALPAQSLPEHYADPSRDEAKPLPDASDSDKKSSGSSSSPSSPSAQVKPIKSYSSKNSPKPAASAGDKSAPQKRSGQ